MPRTRPSLRSLVIVAALAVAYALWTLVVEAGLTEDFDRASVAPGLAPSSAAAEIWAAIAIITAPPVLYAGLAVLSIWAYRRRLRNLAYALVMGIPLGWGSHLGFKALFRRPRPEAALELITGTGWAYPSGHLVAVTVTATLVVATVVVTRQGRLARGMTVGLGLLAIAVVAYCRLAAGRVACLITGGHHLGQ